MTKNRLKSYRQAASEERTYLRGRISGDIKSMITPWKSLNRAGIEGLEWGTVNLLGAMSGVGKTAIINELVFSCHELNPEQEISVLFFTPEMAARRLISRMVSRELHMPVKDIYKGDEDLIKKVETEILPKYKDRDIQYVEYVHTVETIVEIIKTFCKQRIGKNCLIIYDHSLLIKKEPGESERATLVALGTQLLSLKKQFPESQYIVLSQLNRDIERPERIRDKMLHYPKKSDIFGSDGFWHASDIAMVLHNPSALNITQYGPHKYPTGGYLFAHLLKVREGKPGMFVISNQAHVNRFPQLSVGQLTAQGFKLN